MQVLPAIAIVILNYNGRQYLQQFLPSVLASTYANKRVIVGDNASTDDSLGWLAEHYPDVEVIVNAENYGFARGYNEVLKQVQAEYYVLLNSDVEVKAGWIEPVLKLMEGDKTIAACQPKILNENNRTEFEYAGAAGGWIDMFGYPFSRGRIFDICEKDEGQYDNPAFIFWASGAALFIRSKLFLNAGGFDEYFFAHQEEIDLCWRLQRAGYRIAACPQSVVYHVGGGTLPKGQRKLFLNFRNNLVMLLKNWTLAEVLWKFPVRIGLDASAAVKNLLGGNTDFAVAILKAHLALWRWLFTPAKAKNTNSGGKKDLKGVYYGSLVYQYFIKKKKTFAEIVGESQ